MDPATFDRISQLFSARRLTRRDTIRRAGVAGATALATGLGVRAAAAQEATLATGTPGAEGGAAAGEPAKVEFLFVQSFQSGAIAPVDGQDGRYTITLEHGLGQTIYFSDRPDRIVGATPTDRFLGGIGFLEDNPPNAALVLETGAGETDLAVVELYDPVYDEANRTLTYEVATLENWEDSVDLGFGEAPTDLAQVAPSFGAAHLFIEDCPDGSIACVSNGANQGSISDHGGYCYSWSAGNCYTCTPNKDDFAADVVYWTSRCNQRFPICGGNCIARNVCGGGFLCPAGDHF